MRTFANSADPVLQTLQNMASDQDLQCFLTGISMQITEKKQQPKISILWNANIPCHSEEKVHFIAFVIFSTGGHLEFLTRLKFLILKP